MFGESIVRACEGVLSADPESAYMIYISGICSEEFESSKVSVSAALIVCVSGESSALNRSSRIS